MIITLKSKKELEWERVEVILVVNNEPVVATFTSDQVIKSLDAGKS